MGLCYIFQTLISNRAESTPAQQQQEGKYWHFRLQSASAEESGSLATVIQAIFKISSV